MDLDQTSLFPFARDSSTRVSLNVVSDNPPVFGSKRRLAAQDFDGDHRLLDLGGGRLQRALYDKAHKTAGALRIGKGHARQKPVELYAHPLRFHGPNLIMDPPGHGV